jgi:hypothetical protein
MEVSHADLDNARTVSQLWRNERRANQMRAVRDRGLREVHRQPRDKLLQDLPEVYVEEAPLRILVELTPRQTARRCA